MFGETRFRMETWIRLTNTGRAEARDVEWSVTDNGLHFHAGRSSLEVIHPGEYYDVPYTKVGGSEPDPVFTVSWHDERGRHTTERILSP